MTTALLLYSLCLCITVGCATSHSLAVCIALLATFYAARMWWRGLTRPTRAVPVLDLTALPRAVAIPTSFRRRNWKD